MVDIEIMFKVFKLVWIFRFLLLGNLKWRIVLDYYLKGVGGFNFLLRCNYDEKYLFLLLVFYGNILRYFRELKILYNYN